MLLYILKSPSCFVQNKRFALYIWSHSCYVPSSNNLMNQQCTISFKATCLYPSDSRLLRRPLSSFLKDGEMNAQSKLRRYCNSISSSTPVLDFFFILKEVMCIMSHVIMPHNITPMEKCVIRSEFSLAPSVWLWEVHGINKSKNQKVTFSVQCSMHLCCATHLWFIQPCWEKVGAI